MDSPPIPAPLPTRALRRSGSGLRTPRPHLHALTSGIALIIASVLGPLLLFVLGLWDRFTLLHRTGPRLLAVLWSVLLIGCCVVFIIGSVGFFCYGSVLQVWHWLTSTR